MNKRTTDYDLCYQCGWLGLCVVACPLADPARAIRPDASTHPDIQDAGANDEFEIVIESQPAPQSRPVRPPAQELS